MSRAVSALQRTWTDARRAVSWTRPTTSEVATVLKAGLAAGVSFAVARLVTDVPNPLLAPATAIVTVHATAWTSLRVAVQRSIAVAVGVIIALAIGDAVPLNAASITILVTVSLGISVLVLRFSGGAANQLPITVLLVVAVVSTGQKSYAVGRAVDTMIGAAIGAAVAIALPASRLGDARDGLAQLASELAACLEAMGHGVQQKWTADSTEAWEERAQRIRGRLARRAVDAVGSGRRAAHWNYRDRRHLDDLSLYEDIAPRLERVSVSVAEIARDLDRTVARSPGAHEPTPKLGALLMALASAVDAYGGQLHGTEDDTRLLRALEDVRIRRIAGQGGATRRARLAVDGGATAPDSTANEWLDYGSILLQGDAIAADLRPDASERDVSATPPRADRGADGRRP